jgi:pyridoxine kinase
MVERMRWLVGKAHCITPNYSEACWLLNKPYAPESYTERIQDWLLQLTEMGPEIAVITSAPVAERPRDSSVVGYHRGHRHFWKVDCPYIPAFYPGTGDIFTSVLTGSLLQGDSLPLAMDRAVHFVTQGIRATFGHAEPSHYGILLERVLETLRSPAALAGYELMAEAGV